MAELTLHSDFYKIGEEIETPLKPQLQRAHNSVIRHSALLKTGNKTVGRGFFLGERKVVVMGHLLEKEGQSLNFYDRPKNIHSAFDVTLQETNTGMCVLKARMTPKVGPIKVTNRAVHEDSYVFLLERFARSTKIHRLSLLEDPDKILETGKNKEGEEAMIIEVDKVDIDHFGGLVFNRFGDMLGVVYCRYDGDSVMVMKTASMIDVAERSK